MRSGRALPFLTSLLSIAVALPLASRVDAQQQPAATPTPAVQPTPPPADTTPKGLLGVAAAEAERTRNQLKSSILGKLRSYAAQHEQAADQGASFVKAIVELGADAVPVLLDALRDVGGGKQDAAYAAPAARALAGVYDRTKNAKVLESVAEILKASENVAVRAAVLDGLATLDHPMVVEMVAPLLHDPTAALRVQAVRVLGRQKSHADQVGALLRPMLQESGAPWPETVAALDAIGDKLALEPVLALLGRCDEPAFLVAAIHYVYDHGTKLALPALRQLLMKGSNGVADKTLEQAVDAAQVIGLREVDARKTAEELLVDVFKTHPNAVVKEHAQWQLGPYANEEALKLRESSVVENIKETKKNGRSTTGLYIELATVRLHFENWKGARQALDKARDEDDKKFSETKIKEYEFVSWVGEGKRLSDAENFLRKFVSIEERAELLRDYPCLTTLQKKFPDLFPLKK